MKKSARIPPLMQLREKLMGCFAELMEQPGFEERARELARLERESARYALSALNALGWEFRRGQTFTVAEMASALGVVKRHRRLLERLLIMLADDGLLGRSDERWEIISGPPEPGISGESDEYGKCAEAVLLKHCAPRLAEVLKGDIDPLQVLFPDGDSTMVARVYREGFMMREMNTLLRKALELALASLPPARRCRILEIGAGTGSTAMFLLPHLPPDRTEYTFTDVSPEFIQEAPERFRDYPFVKYGILNIEQDPVAQGFAGRRHDFVLATNVFHATRDLCETLRNARQLLVPGGMLVFLEITAPVRWVDLVFGMTQGWWRFTDIAVRPSHPLLPAARWLELLDNCGFEEAFCISPDDLAVAGRGGKMFPQSLLAAKAT